MPEIKCMVSTCHYYRKKDGKDVCTADAIEVNNQKNSQAKTSEETICSTFIPDVKV